MSPKISYFLGITILMRWEDHNPPHIHAQYQGYEASIDFQDGKVLIGSLPRRALSLVLDWCELHEQELIICWQLAKQSQPLPWIVPLE